jgi:uncharacterized protein YyaL (SSP411 family)
MAHESFSNPETASLLNEHFICIKVDREQRPDLDGIYMQATTALTGAGGWPMSVFLTPDLRPFYAGTYFPPVRSFGRPAFNEVLLALTRAWGNAPGDVRAAANQVTDQLGQPATMVEARTISEGDLDTATRVLLGAYDWLNGGWGPAPRFPQPMSIDYLLGRAAVHASEGIQAQKAALHGLKAMARGGMYDVVGGGFSRYSTDDDWRVPHFEKMLYDNAQLAVVYLHAWQLTRDPSYRQVATQTLDFVIREMTDSAGGFYSSLDADSDGKEGQFYAWTADEIRELLGGEPLYAFFTQAYRITDRGNWEGQTLLQRALDDSTLASRFGIDVEEVGPRLDQCHKILLNARSHRTRPAVDDKILAAWNGLTLAAFAEAGRVVDEPAKKTAYLEMATRNAHFLLSHLRPGGTLRRMWRAGHAGDEVFLEDYGAVILGLLQLYQSDFDPRWFAAARQLANEMVGQFADPSGGFFDTPANATELLFRPKDLQDNATPSGNSLAAEALLELADLSDDRHFRNLAEGSLRLVGNDAARYPISFPRWLSAADRALAGSQQVAILFPTAERPTELVDILRERFRPRLLAAVSSYPPAENAPPLLAARAAVGGLPTAYVCRDFQCKMPVTDAAALRRLL